MVRSCDFASDRLVLCFTEVKLFTSLELSFVWFYPQATRFVARIQWRITTFKPVSEYFAYLEYDSAFNHNNLEYFNRFQF